MVSERTPMIVWFPCLSNTCFCLFAKRMEPQFMIMGQSAGVAAAMAVNNTKVLLTTKVTGPGAGAGAGVGTRTGSNANVHTIDLDVLHSHLLAQGQRMNEACQAPPRVPTPPPAPTPPPPMRLTVSGAGDSGCNGVYVLNTSTPWGDRGTPVYTKQQQQRRQQQQQQQQQWKQHDVLGGAGSVAEVELEIYRLDGEWRIAHSPTTLFYVAQGNGQGAPPSGSTGKWDGVGSANCKRCQGQLPDPQLALDAV
jgi:hypothetical protein